MLPFFSTILSEPNYVNVKKDIFLIHYFRISISSWHFGLCGSGERQEGWPNWRRFSRWAEQWALFDVTGWPSCWIHLVTISRVSIKWLVTRMETVSPFFSINIGNVSQEKDRNQFGSLHVDQVAEIFRVYEVNRDTICVSGNGLVMPNFLWLSGQSWWSGGTKSNNKRWTDFKSMVKSWKPQILKQKTF